MDKRTFRRISSFIIFKSLFAMLLFQSTLSAPVNSTISYDTFLKNITRDNCAFPNGIVLPFKESHITFQYFSEILKICKAPEAMKRSLEAITLCSEIYDALRNITCHSDKNIQLPEIKVDFSDDVCKDINSLQLQHSPDEHGLLQHLTDKLICEIMCEDDFLPACKVLLWSFQLKKRIDGAPAVESVQNTDQGNKAGNEGASSGISKSLLNPNPEDPALGKTSQLLKSNQEIPVVEADKNERHQTLKDNSDVKKNIEGGNEIPGDPKVEGEQNQEEPKTETDNELSGKQDQTLNVGEQSQLSQIGNEALNAKLGTTKSKVNEQTQLINNQPVKENKIDVDEGPPKLSAFTSKKTVFKNKPAVLIPEQVNIINNKTEPKKDILNIQNNLLPESQKESQVNVKPIDTTNNNNTYNNLKPAISEQNNDLNKLQETLSRPSTPSKMSDVANEAKVSIKSEVTPSKNNEVADTKVIPTIGKEDEVTVTTVADLEKMEEGNGIPAPADKEPDLYNDMESEGEYSKVEYDEDGFYDSSKSKKPEESESGKISKPTLAENELPKHDVFPPRNGFGRGPDDIQVIPAFPEQEDSHFFFYFISLVLILMAGYILFHNKQKIIALIVEGRHERRRRLHGLGYKKLETK